MSYVSKEHIGSSYTSIFCICVVSRFLKKGGGTSKQASGLNTHSLKSEGKDRALENMGTLCGGTGSVDDFDLGFFFLFCFLQQKDIKRWSLRICLTNDSNRAAVSSDRLEMSHGL